MEETLYLIDASGYIFRAYHALPPFSTSTGIPTGAVYGYTTLLLRMLQEHKPRLVAAAFDAARDTFRTAEYADYKANRPELPPDLAPQFPLIFEMTKALQLPILLAKGFEADDLIATAVKEAKAEGRKVIIFSGDKDLMQLVDDKVSLFDPMRSKLYGPAEVREKFGVEPSQVADLLGLMGDSSDNLPGVPGIGPKTAAELLNLFGTLENVLASTDKLKGKRREMLEKHAEDAVLSKKLALLHDNAPLPGKIGEFVYRGFSRSDISEIFTRLEFHKLLNQLTPELAATSAESVKIDRSRYRSILDEEGLKSVVASLQEAKSFSVDLETTGLDAHRAEIVGISLSWAEGEACYLPVSHRFLGVPKQLPSAEVLTALKPFLEDQSRQLFAQHEKYERSIFRRYGIELAPISVDTMLAGYLLDPEESHSLDALAARYLQHKMISYQDVTGKGKHQISFEEVDIPRATEYSAEDADVTYRLAKILLPKVESKGLLSLLQGVEQPLSMLLSKIESNGVKIDVGYLREMSMQFAKELVELEQRCHTLAGGPFQVSSPKQLQEVLFERLKLPTGKKTKSGASTDSSVLEELDHPLAKAVLAYRQIAKLKSTYLDALPQLVNPRTGRIHTSFNQAVTATGRLSSSEPNLQNVPVRNELGRRIRKAFVAEAGCQIASFDYSQIELRLLAHFSRDPAFVAAFQAGEDIHRRTASEMLGKPLDQVTSEDRRVAKSLNFGLLYGMGAFRLKQELGISQTQAQGYIDKYFARYASIRGYFEGVLSEVRKSLEVRTLLGRRRAIADINHPNYQVRSNAERMAINTPIQGSAADLIKVAMLRVDAACQKEKLSAKMILQVHDELLFEVPEAEIAVLQPLVKATMEAVGTELGLSVPLLVDSGVGPSWDDAH